MNLERSIEYIYYRVNNRSSQLPFPRRQPYLQADRGAVPLMGIPGRHRRRLLRLLHGGASLTSTVGCGKGGTAPTAPPERLLLEADTAIALPLNPFVAAPSEPATISQAEYASIHKLLLIIISGFITRNFRTKHNF